MITPESIDVLVLPSLPLTERNQLPYCQALYFVLNAEKAIIYIGRAKSLRQRWVRHHKSFPETENIHIAWLTVDDSALLYEIERAHIAYFQPRFNRETKYQFHNDNPHAAHLSQDLIDVFREVLREQILQGQEIVNARATMLIEKLSKRI